MSSYGTSSPVLGSTRFWAIRPPVVLLSWWNRTVLRLTAEYIFTGTVTRPKLIVPVQMDRAMALHYPRWGTISGGPHGTLRLVDPLAELLDHLLVEGLEVVGLARGDEPLVDDDLLID